MILVSLLWLGSAQALTLEEYLAEVRKNHKEFQSLDISREAAEDRRKAGDLSLTPALVMGASYLNDQKMPQTSGGTQLMTDQYNLGIEKLFSSGTKVGLSGTVQKIEIANPLFPGIPGEYSTGSLGVSLSQSLWKNSFGQGIRLRQQREAVTASLEKESYNLQQRQILINAEMAYWDYLYQAEELQQKKESLERARKIETWLKRRFQDGISDKADYLNAQALTASRELALEVTRDQSLAAEKNVRDFLELSPTEKLPVLSSDFKKARALSVSVSADGSGEVVRLDSYLSALEAKAKGIGAKEARDALRPDLVLQGAYSTNSNVQSSPSEALNRISNTAIPSTQVGVQFTYLFDSDAKVSQESLARKEALAAQYRSERKMLESESSWSELQRRYGELLKQIETAEKLSRLQLSRAKEQSLKLSRGRSVTSDVVMAEEDASSSALALNRLRSEARKLEAQSRLFIRLNQTN